VISELAVQVQTFKTLISLEAIGIGVLPAESHATVPQRHVVSRQSSTIGTWQELAEPIKIGFIYMNFSQQ
jgi:hypothetical protein